MIVCVCVWVALGVAGRRVYPWSVLKVTCWVQSVMGIAGEASGERVVWQMRVEVGV